MGKPGDRTVYKHPDGWADKRNGATKPDKVYPTKAEAVAAAKQHSANVGGGEVTAQGRDGKFNDKDTVPPGHDPNPPRDREH